MYIAGVSISIGSSTVFLTEGEMKKICAMVSTNQQQHDRDIPLLLSAVTNSNASGMCLKLNSYTCMHFMQC